MSLVEELQKKAKTLATWQSMIPRRSGSKVYVNPDIELVSLVDVQDFLLTKEHLIRKQLEENWMPRCKLEDCINWMNGDCGYGLHWRLGYCKEYPKLLKGLLVSHVKKTMVTSE